MFSISAKISSSILSVSATHIFKKSWLIFTFACLPTDNDASDCYLVLRGSVGLFSCYRNRQTWKFELIEKLDEIRFGGFFGEYELVSERPRLIAASSLEDGTILARLERGKHN